MSNIATVSIIMRTKDRSPLLRRAIDSVLRQDYVHCELIIVNDGGSVEPVEDIISELAGRSNNMKYLLLDHKTTVGRGGALNKGIEVATGRYVAFLDDDDTWEPTFLSQSLSVLKQQAALGGTTCYAQVVFEQMAGINIEHLKTEPYGHRLNHIDLFDLVAGNFITINSLVLNRSCCQEVGQFSDSLEVLEDWDFLVRFCSLYEIGVVPKVLASYHKRIKADDPAYLSTEMTGNYNYARGYNRIINGWLREDLKSGRFGLGMLASHSRRLQWLLKQKN